MAYRVRIRRFLNLVGYQAGAYILAVVENSIHHERGEHGWPYVDIDLTLADCGRVVSFDFDLSSKGARRNSLRKIDLVIDSLVEFRRALREEAAIAAERGER